MPDRIVESPGFSVDGVAVSVVSNASTVIVAVAGVFDTAPTAVTTTGPAGVPGRTGRMAVMSPSGPASTTTGVPPGMETETDSPGRKPVPVTVVLPPGRSVSGSAVIAVS